MGADKNLREENQEKDVTIQKSQTQFGFINEHASGHLLSETLGCRGTQQFLPSRGPKSG